MSNFMIHFSKIKTVIPCIKGMQLITLFCNIKKNVALRNYATGATQSSFVPLRTTKKSKKVSESHNVRIKNYFNERIQLKAIMKHIPTKYFGQNRQKHLSHLYLVNTLFAKDIAKRVFSDINDDHIVCETNAGLGLISIELLKMGTKNVRLYESCPQFRSYLHNLTKYPTRMDIYNKDMYSLNCLSYLDKQDKGCRVHQMLEGIPYRRWDEDPVMTIVGPMPNLNFIKYLTRMIILQQEIAAVGRPQIFALMFPEDYIILNATPEMKLRMYQPNSILFQLFFDCQFIEKYRKQSFLPWKYNRKRLSKYSFLKDSIKDYEDYIYLVKITPKTDLPVSDEHLLHLFYYVKQGFQKGRQRVIPTVEKWLPGIGAKLIILPEKHKKHFLRNIDIYTEFGGLSPVEILQIFLIMLEDPEFNIGPFIPMMESHLVKDETIDTDLAEIDGNAIEDIEEETEIH